MKLFCVWLPVAVLAGLPALRGQTQVDLRTQSKSVDFSAASSTKPSQTGTVLPSTCSVGATFFNTTAAAGQNLFGCTATNRWTLLGANLWYGGGGFQTGDCAAFNSSGNIVSAGGACGPATAVTLATPFTLAGSLLVSGGPGRSAVGSTCTNSGGTISCPGGFAGSVTWLGGSGTNGRQIQGPAGPFTSSFNYIWADAVPTAATLMKIGTPSGGASSLGPAIPDTDYVTPSGAGTIQNKTFDGTSIFSSYSPWSQIATPGAPGAGYLRVYAKTGVGLCWINSVGVETCPGGDISDPGGSGLLVETSPGVTANRTLTAGSSNISIMNGSGAGGNPAIDLGATVNLSGKTTLPVEVGLTASMPATCTVGQLYFASDQPAGRQLESCTATNTWTPAAYAQGTVNPVSCTTGQIYFNTSAAAGQNLYLCTAANAWSAMTGAVTSIFGRTGAITAQTGDYTYAQIANAPAALPPNGMASGDLSGSYPNPVVSQINGAAIPAPGVVKANGNHQLVAATAGTDYAPATSGAGVLKGNGAGGFAAAVSGTDYMAVTTPVEASQMPALSGDCVSAAGSVATTCGKTNGVAFAPSATTDATNAGNISTGTLNAARLPATAMQTNQSNAVTGGTQDFHAATHTLPIAAGPGANKPASCTVGEEYFATDAIAGLNQYYCTAADVWTQQAGGATAGVASVFGRTGAVSAQAGDYTYAQIANTPAAMPPNGAAAGDLSGTYPHPTVTQINGAAIPTSGMLKANSAGQLATAVPGTDYAPALTFGGMLTQTGNAVNCGVASGTTAGCVTSVDWNTFNSKQSALVDPVTGTGTPGGLAKFTAAGTIGSAVTGTDYAPATPGPWVLKGDGNGGFTAAAAGTDFAPATTGTSMLKGSGTGGFTAAAAGTDFAPATTGTSMLKGSGTGGFTAAAAGTDFAPATSGSAVLKGNGTGGFTAAVAGTDFAPATSGTSMLKGSGTGGFTAAAAGTDFAPATTGSAVLKGNGTGGFTAAAAGTDFAPATPGSAVLKGNGTGGFTAAVAGTDFAPVTTGSAVLKGNGTGGFAAALAGTDYMGITTAVAATQMPALSGDCVSTTGSTATTCGKTNGVAFAASATTDTTNASNISSGTLNGGRLPATAMQTNQSNAVTGGTQDFHAAAHTLPMAAGPGASKPANCTVGEEYFATDATPGTNEFYCTSTNGWTQQAGGGTAAVTSVFGRTGAVTAQTGDYSYAQISNTPAAMPPSGTASGDLSGTYPHPTVTQINGAAIPTSGMLKANSSGQLAAAAAGTDYAPATSGSGVLKGSGTGGFSSAAAADVVGLFTGCSGTEYLGADGACHTVSSGGGGSMVLSTGSGAPSASCAGPSSTNLAVYLDTTNQNEWWCSAANTWQKVLSVTGSGPYQVTGTTGTAPSTPSSGTVTCYFAGSGSSAQICLDSSGNAWTMLPPSATAIANSTTGNAATATALASAPSTCSSGHAPTGISASGAAQGCTAYTQTIASGTVSLGTTAVGANTCSAAITVTATGVATTDTITATANADPTSVTGYSPASSGAFFIWAYPTTGDVNFKLCNNTSSSITPGSAVTLNWRVVR